MVLHRLANSQHWAIMKEGLATLASGLHDDQGGQPGLMNVLQDFPRRANGNSLMLCPKWYARLFSGDLELESSPAGDISAAQGDIKHLTLMQLLFIRTRYLHSLETVSGHYRAHKNFLEMIEERLYLYIGQMCIAGLEADALRQDDVVSDSDDPDVLVKRSVYWNEWRRNVNNMVDSARELDEAVRAADAGGIDPEAAESALIDTEDGERLSGFQPSAARYSVSVDSHLRKSAVAWSSVSRASAACVARTREAGRMSVGDASDWVVRASAAMAEHTKPMMGKATPKSKAKPRGSRSGSASPRGESPTTHRGSAVKPHTSATTHKAGTRSPRGSPLGPKVSAQHAPKPHADGSTTLPASHAKHHVKASHKPKHESGKGGRHSGAVHSFAPKRRPSSQQLRASCALHKNKSSMSTRIGGKAAILMRRRGRRMERRPSTSEFMHSMKRKICFVSDLQGISLTAKGVDIERCQSLQQLGRNLVMASGAYYCIACAEESTEKNLKKAQKAETMKHLREVSTKVQYALSVLDQETRFKTNGVTVSNEDKPYSGQTSSIFCLELYERYKWLAQCGATIVAGHTHSPGQVLGAKSAKPLTDKVETNAIYTDRLTEKLERGYFFYDSLTGTAGWDLQEDIEACVILDWSKHLERTVITGASGTTGQTVNWEIWEGRPTNDNWVKELEKNPSCQLLQKAAQEFSGDLKTMLAAQKVKAAETEQTFANNPYERKVSTRKKSFLAFQKAQSAQRTSLMSVPKSSDENDNSSSRGSNAPGFTNRTQMGSAAKMIQQFDSGSIKQYKSPPTSQLSVITESQRGSAAMASNGPVADELHSRESAAMSVPVGGDGDRDSWDERVEARESAAVAGRDHLRDTVQEEPMAGLHDDDLMWEDVVEEAVHSPSAKSYFTVFSDSPKSLF